MPMVSLKLMAGAARSMVVASAGTTAAEITVRACGGVQGRSFTPSTCLIWIAVSNTRAHAEPGAEPITETAPESPESETAAKPGSEKASRSPKRRQ